MYYTGVKEESKYVLDWCGAFKSSADISLPSAFTLDDKLIPDVRDQGKVNSCVGFATTNIMQILNQIETGDRDRFSAGYVYGKCRDDNATYEGMYISSALNYLIKTGSCFENDFPYNEEMPTIRERVLEHPELDDKAKPYHIRAYEVYASANKETRYNDIKTAMYTHKVPILADATFSVGSHAVCIIGWDDNKERWKILNSWGKSWGNNGIGSISYDKLNRGYLLMDEKNSDTIMPFEDVSKDEWYYRAVEHVYNAGFMNGTSDTTFEPERAMTRAEVAQVLVNFAKKIDDTLKE